MNTLRKSLLIFTLATIAMSFIFRFMPGNYKVSVNDSLNPEFTELGVSPVDFRGIANSGGKKLMILDLRDAESFSSAHINDAVNIPVEQILSRKHLRGIKKKDVYLYSDSEKESHRIAYLLSMLGVQARAVNSNFENIAKVMKGGSGPAENFSSEEKVEYDYSVHFKAYSDVKPAKEVKIDLIKPSPGGC